MRIIDISSAVYTEPDKNGWRYSDFVLGSGQAFEYNERTVAMPGDRVLIQVHEPSGVTTLIVNPKTCPRCDAILRGGVCPVCGFYE